MNLSKETVTAMLVSVILTAIVFTVVTKLTLLTIIILSVVCIYLFVYVPARMCDKQKLTFRAKLWTALHISFQPGITGRVPLPLFILSIVVAIASNAKVPFPATLSLIVEEDRKKRFGKKPITQRQHATILASGPFALTIFALLLHALSLDKLLIIPLSIACVHVLPLPNLPGGMMFFLSPPLYFSLFMYVLLLTILIYALPAIPALILTLVFTAILLAAFYHRRFVKK